MLVNEALEAVLQSFSVKNSEFVALSEAYGRVLSHDVVAVKNLPCFDNSALDGYAVKFDEREQPYRVVDSVFAGDKRTTSINAHECIKIMTGAKMPLGADTIIRLEDCEEKDGYVNAPANLKRGEAHRFAGEEVRVGEILLRAGERISATATMMLAAQGISFVSVRSCPRVGIFSSGDEIKEPWQTADNDEIYNANAVGIGALLCSAGFNSSYLGIIADDFEETKAAFEQAGSFDVLISSGGASKGEADFMKAALMQLGYTQLFGWINVRPGGPCKAYIKDGRVVFVLPGNPMAAYLCTLLLVLPMLLGRNLEQEKVVLAENLQLKSGRSNVVLGSVKNGKFVLTDGNKFGSGMIKPLLKSNAIYLSNPDESELLAGSEIFITRLA